MTAPIKGSAKIASDGKVTQLGGRAAPDEVVTEKDVQDPAKLAKLLARVLSNLATLRRAWAPRSIDFEDQVADAVTPITLQHNFNGRVRWWVVDWSDNAGTRINIYRDPANTTANTLVLTSLVVGIVTIRVEEAG